MWATEVRAHPIYRWKYTVHGDRMRAVQTFGTFDYQVENLAYSNYRQLKE